jgi:hypothetical protein
MTQGWRKSTEGSDVRQQKRCAGDEGVGAGSGASGVVYATSGTQMHTHPQQKDHAPTHKESQVSVCEFGGGGSG